MLRSWALAAAVARMGRSAKATRVWSKGVTLVTAWRDAAQTQRAQRETLGDALFYRKVRAFMFVVCYLS